MCERALVCASYDVFTSKMAHGLGICDPLHHHRHTSRSGCVKHRTTGKVYQIYFLRLFRCAPSERAHTPFFHWYHLVATRLRTPYTLAHFLTNTCFKLVFETNKVCMRQLIILYTYIFLSHYTRFFHSHQVESNVRMTLPTRPPLPSKGNLLFDSIKEYENDNF